MHYVSISGIHVLCLQLSSQYNHAVSVVQAQGLNAVFECRYPGAQSRNWGFNGEVPTDNSYIPTQCDCYSTIW